MTLHLDLLRHGETELGGGLRGSLDDALTAKGWEQMRAAVAEQGPWDRLVSSTFSSRSRGKPRACASSSRITPPWLINSTRCAAYA